MGLTKAIWHYILGSRFFFALSPGPVTGRKISPDRQPKGTISRAGTWMI
jgi:hypothetical protein